MKIGQTKTFRHIRIEYCKSKENIDWGFWEVSAVKNKKINRDLERCSGNIEVDDKGVYFTSCGSYNGEKYLCNSIFSSGENNLKSIKVVKEFVEDIEKAMLFVKNEWDRGRVI